MAFVNQQQSVLASLFPHTVTYIVAGSMRCCRFAFVVVADEQVLSVRHTSNADLSKMLLDLLFV